MFLFVLTHPLGYVFKNNICYSYQDDGESIQFNYEFVKDFKEVLRDYGWGKRIYHSSENGDKIISF